MAGLFSIREDMHYDIVRKIHDGGMGIVYEAEQHGVRDFVKRVAIKVIRDDFARQEMFLSNFVGEAKLVAELIHTNIVQTYQLGEANGVLYIAMELIHGVNLEQFMHELLRKNQVLPVELAVFIVSRIARGLAYAHAKTGKDGKPLGIVHRDVSFKNIMIAYEGDVKLTDFGIAKAAGLLKSEEGKVVAGKPEYMSPEQADFKATDPRSDIFSAGIVLSYLLLRRNIFKGKTSEESRSNVIGLPMPNFRSEDPRIDEKLDRIVKRALERDIDRRYQEADEFLFELEKYIYEPGYGPTNETMGKFVRQLFSDGAPSKSTTPGGTRLIERTARITRGRAKSPAIRVKLAGDR